jgi:glyoxylase-like metal-dependent hydrolase (beta-lactamase superfamily II)
MIDEIHAFAGGYCRQLLAMIDRRSWRMVRFPAVYFALRHQREGWVLIDTGYGGRFSEATRRFPFRGYRWATPTTEAGRTADQLRSAGIPPEDIRHLIVTHFHADHIGGLADLPQATVHYHAEALAPLQRLPAWRQARAAFLPALVPGWLPDRAMPLAAEAFVARPDLPFGSHDLFGDGSIRLVDLPGHAPGQLGVIFARGTQREFYVADAFWRRCQIVEGVEPLGLAMSFQWDPLAYRATVHRLREVYRGGEFNLIACHDDGAAAQLNGTRIGR